MNHNTFLRAYCVTTTLGKLKVKAFNLAHAINIGLELLGGQLLSCIHEDDW